MRIHDALSHAYTFGYISMPHTGVFVFFGGLLLHSRPGQRVLTVLPTLLQASRGTTITFSTRAAPTFLLKRTKALRSKSTITTQGGRLVNSPSCTVRMHSGCCSTVSSNARTRTCRYNAPSCTVLYIPAYIYRQQICETHTRTRTRAQRFTTDFTTHFTTGDK